MLDSYNEITTLRNSVDNLRMEMSYLDSRTISPVLRSFLESLVANVCGVEEALATLLEELWDREEPLTPTP